MQQLTTLILLGEAQVVVNNSGSTVLHFILTLTKIASNPKGGPFMVSPPPGAEAEVHSLTLFLFPPLTQKHFSRRVERTGISPPPLFYLPVPVRLPKQQNRRQVLLQEVDSLVSKLALETPSAGSAGFYSHRFTVEKKSGAFRPVIDLNLLKRHVIRRKSNVESGLSELRQLQRG